MFSKSKESLNEISKLENSSGKEKNLQKNESQSSKKPFSIDELLYNDEKMSENEEQSSGKFNWKMVNSYGSKLICSVSPNAFVSRNSLTCKSEENEKKVSFINSSGKDVMSNYESDFNSSVPGFSSSKIVRIIKYKYKLHLIITTD